MYEVLWQLHGPDGVLRREGVLRFRTQAFAEGVVTGLFWEFEYTCRIVFRP